MKTFPDSGPIRADDLLRSLQKTRDQRYPKNSRMATAAVLEIAKSHVPKCIAMNVL